MNYFGYGMSTLYFIVVYGSEGHKPIMVTTFEVSHILTNAILDMTETLFAIITNKIQRENLLNEQMIV